MSIGLPFQIINGRTRFPFPYLRPACQPCTRRVHTFRHVTTNRSALITANANSNGARYFLCPVLSCYCQRHELKLGNVGTVLICPVGTLTASRTGQLTRLVRGDPRLHGGIATNVCIKRVDRNNDSGSGRTVATAGVIADRSRLLGGPPSVLLAGCGVLSCLLIHPGSSQV